MNIIMTPTLHSSEECLGCDLEKKKLTVIYFTSCKFNRSSNCLTKNRQDEDREKWRLITIRPWILTVRCPANFDGILGPDFQYPSRK